MNHTATSASLRVALCVVTYRRNPELERLLLSVSQLSTARAAGVDFKVIIVDNNPAFSAEEVWQRWHSRLGFSLIFSRCGAQDIVSGRNHALEVGLEHSDVVCFVDDDESLETTWLESVFRHFAGDASTSILTGPVKPVFKPGADTAVVRSGVFHGLAARPHSGSPIPTTTTANVAFRAEIVRRTRLRFDWRMSTTGGEDYVFFRQLVALGHRIDWDDNMAVQDHIPSERVTVKWFSKRCLRKGNTLARGDFLVIGRRKTLLRRLPRSIARLQFSALSGALEFFGTGKLPLSAVGNALAACGTLIGLAGFTVHEYKKR